MYDFYKTLGVPGVPEYFSEVVEALECLSSLEILSYHFYKTLGVPGDLGLFFNVIQGLPLLSVQSNLLILDTKNWPISNILGSI